MWYLFKSGYNLVSTFNLRDHVESDLDLNLGLGLRLESIIRSKSFTFKFVGCNGSKVLIFIR